MKNSSPVELDLIRGETEDFYPTESDLIRSGTDPSQS